MEVGGKHRIIGANEKTIKITTSGARFDVKLRLEDPQTRSGKFDDDGSIRAADQVYLERRMCVGISMLTSSRYP
jgi:hypothetical protein